ncbi:lantibiotic immunity ABC transporter MutE/EpiE family permease subunit [Frisingicoccus caecimuris]|uniref:ABC-2 type transport system permease protein n=1 Tax=Frisingicoccus caecimuris TaxID=1796636 RepID=A0A4V2SDL6_9FIRM|nr:lantibiotic immunity ABC transporter MutE/EpiE family permease subunit [Frisingicoccus caecimuris]MCR1919395.1 lantibiotic immunity ABC transporter MutE/EpiE family permease subunit [Frisingicoccus caecimuris]TCO84115.1 ABC-2 type transport system permease protein [Frisingicoccus caecimuris]
MEMAYIQAENLKHKRTFTKTLMILAPFVTALMNFFAPLWFQLNSYNWWYILLYPGFLTLTCALIEQRDNGKLKYRAVALLPVSQNKVWKAKIGVAGSYSCVGNFIFMALNLLGGFAILVINQIPLTIGVGQAIAGTACIVIASLWEIPLCLWLSKKVGIFVAVILNAGLGSVLGIFTATTSLWMICPYSWVPHLMISVLGILPNGEPVPDQSAAMAFWMILLVLVTSLAWFAVLSFLTARWFEKKEVG